MTKNNLKLQEKVLQMLIDNFAEEGIVENRRDDSDQCFYLKDAIKSCMKKRQKVTELIDSREDNTHGKRVLEMLVPLPD